MEFPRHSGNGSSPEAVKAQVLKKPQEGRVMCKVVNTFLCNSKGDYDCDGVIYSAGGVESYLTLDKTQADSIHKQAYQDVKNKTNDNHCPDDILVFQRELELASLVIYRSKIS